MRSMTTAVLFGALGLAACTSQNFTEVTDLSQEQARLEDRIGSMSPMATSDLPTTGSAFYEGVMQVDYVNLYDASAPHERLLGEVEMQVDFATSTIDPGSQANFFYDAEGNRLGGHLDITGTIDRAPGGVLEARADGELTRGDETLTIEAGIDGAFYQDGDATAIAGGVDGIGWLDEESYALDGTFLVIDEPPGG